MSVLVKIAGRLPAPWIRGFSTVRSRAPWLKRATDWIPDLIRGKQGTIQRGVARGLRFDGGQSATGFLLGTHDPGIQAAMAALVRPGMVIYDVGANVGFTSTIAAHLTGPSGKVLCFEPQPDCVRLVARNAQLNGFSQVQVREEALSDEDGTAQFLVSKNSTFSRLVGTGEVDLREKIDVRVRRLDALIADEKLPPPALLKIDVEGAEKGVLLGAMETLRTAKPVLLIELHGTNSDVADALTAAGYETRIVGSKDAILVAHWNSLVIGIPPGRADLAATVEALTDPSVVRPN